ncbi:MAG: MCE family protein [Acidobacteria bacterium]|nr:MAG: MCE family protein [Acidobacteriota bacterium]
MPQRKQLTWTQLRVGVLIISGLIAFAVGVFFISGEGGFLTRHYELKTFFSGAESLRNGAQVRLAGIVVGNVNGINLSPYTEPSRAVQINMKVTQKYQDQIRTDSVATIETAGLLGEAYVDISRGGADSQPIPNGGTVQSHEQADMKQIVQNANDVVSNLRVLSSTLNDITKQIQHGQGSIGRLIYEENFYNNLNKTANEAQKLMTQIQAGHGTLGKFLADETFYDQTVAALDKVNKVLDDVQHGKGSAAKFINDPSIYNNLDQATRRANALMSSINESQGTLGKLIKDPSLYNNLNETVRHVDVIADRIDRGEGTLGRLSTDPAMYSNLLSASQSLRQFLTEFRTNPRKYLTLKVHLF